MAKNSRAKKVAAKSAKKKKARRKVDLIGDIEVHCRYDKLVALSELKPHPNNPARHNGKQVRLLAELIKEHGVRWPITVSNLSGYIVSGHCRTEAAQFLEMPTFPVVFQDFKDSNQELAVLLGDNKIQELRDIDPEQYDRIITELTEHEYPLRLAGVEEQTEVVVNPDDDSQVFREEQTLEPYKKTHVLVSFDPGVYPKIKDSLAALAATKGVEYEQSSD